ncbi:MULTISPECIES: hypothetical protein [Lysinibacillus]|uniref:Uncharacterized protein n=1 Tax=Lysinibacillus xylanilyticus TaxID=582475 RepID=A0ABV3VVS7_9BACI
MFKNMRLPGKIDNEEILVENMFDTTEINDMPMLIKVLNDNESYKKRCFWVDIYDVEEGETRWFDEPKVKKYKFGIMEANTSDTVSITIYKDKGEIEDNRVGRIMPPITFDSREQNSLTNEKRIIRSLASWSSYYKD